MSAEHLRVFLAKNGKGSHGRAGVLEIKKKEKKLHPGSGPLFVRRSRGVGGWALQHRAECPAPAPASTQRGRPGACAMAAGNQSQARGERDTTL